MILKNQTVHFITSCNTDLLITILIISLKSLLISQYIERK